MRRGIMDFNNFLIPITFAGLRRYYCSVIATGVANGRKDLPEDAERRHAWNIGTSARTIESNYNRAESTGLVT
jgi:hypothetical protein